MDSLKSVWQSILDEIAKNITSTAYNTWFSDCEPVELEDCKLVLHTATDFKRNIIQSRFGSTICAALYDLFSIPAPAPPHDRDPAGDGRLHL